jgi:hypothetical protein
MVPIAWHTIIVAFLADTVIVEFSFANRPVEFGLTLETNRMSRCGRYGGAPCAGEKPGMASPGERLQADQVNVGA